MSRSYMPVRPALRYGVAALAVGLALVLKLALDPLFAEQQSPFLLLAGAVMVGAWFGGLGPGLLATALGALAADYLFLPPIGSFAPSGGPVLPLELFGLQGVLISALAQALRSARQRAEESALEARRHQEELRQSEERFRALVQNSSDTITVIDEEGTIRYVSPAVERVSGYRPQELIGKNVYDYVSPRNLEEAHTIFARLLAQPGVHPPFEFDVPHKNGSLRRSEFLVNNLLGDPSVGGVVINQRDVTERKEAERARLESERRFRQLFENSSDALFVHDEKGRFVDCNAEACRALGYSREELLGLSVANVAEHLISEQERQERRGETLWERAMRGEPGRIVGFEENELRRKDGTTFPVEVGVGAIEYEGRRLIFAAARDISERKRAQEDLQRSVNSLRALYEAGQVLASSLEREEIGLKLLQVTQRISALEAAILDLCDERGELEEWHSVGREGVLAALRDHPRAREAAREAAEGGQARSVELPPPGESGRVAGRGGAGVFVPLRVHDGVIGVLEAYGPAALREEESVETLASLASQGASALENARLYGQLAARERELQELVGRIFIAQEEERRRIAYDIHDGLTQTVAAAYRRLELFAQHRPPEAARDREELEGAVALVRRAVDDARRIMANLRPTALDDFGLATAVRLSVEDLRAEGFEASYEETLGEGRLPAVLETALFRITQEALSNVRKHARTERVRVSLGRRNGVVHLEVRDWGRGFEESAGAGRGGGGPGERVGLSSMQERVALLGGSFEIVSEPGKGTSVRAEIPTHQGAAPGKGGGGG